MKRLSVFFLLLCLIGLTLMNIPHVKAPPSITYNAGTNIITVTGFTLVSPCTLLDIWNADVTGGWGVVTRSTGATEQYRFDCRLVFGDGSTETHFSDNNTQIIFSNISVSANAQFLIDVRANAYFTLGVLIDENNKATSDGVSVFLSDTPYQFLRLLSGTSLNSHIFLYNSQLINADDTRCYFYLNGNASAYSRIWNTQFSNIDSIWLAYVDFYNVVWSDSNIGGLASMAFSVRGSITIEDVKAYRNSIIFFSSANIPFSASNMYVRNTTNYLMRATSKVTSVNNRPKLINVDSDNWLFHWLASGLSIDNMIFRQYEFDLTVTYPNGTTINGTETGATVTIQHYGESNGIDYTSTLGEDGTIPLQTLTMGFYNFTGGDAIYDYNPYNIQISNVTGFLDYSKNFTLNEKTEWEVALIDESQAGYGGFVFLFFGLVVGLLIGALVGFGSKTR